MSTLNELIEQIDNTELRKKILGEVNKLNKQKKFGLVFEEHLPECTPLYGVNVKKGNKVAVYNENNKLDLKTIYTVVNINGDNASCISANTNQIETFLIKNLICVAEFGEPIYPYLKPIDSVKNAPDSNLWHTLIEADNYHALQLLGYLYAGKVDCIYIDPPYNTGARDWKYNNDYVDSSDAYRHSKWLSMIERRLKLAKQLLNPNDSVLIITIDEKEYLHLGCLLEEMFPEARMQMVSSVINHAGTGGVGTFGRTNEFLFFLMFGNCEVSAEEEVDGEGKEVAWDSLRRHNPANLRHTRPKQFYPIYIDKTTNKIVKIGDYITPDVDRFSVEQLPNCETVFPVKDDGTEMMWGVTPEVCRYRAEKGYVKVGKYDPSRPQQYSLQFLSSGPIEAIENGDVEIRGRRRDGSVIAVYNTQKKILPKTQWDKDTHDATRYGTNLLSSIIGKRFNYPKSLYAVRDSINFFLSKKPNALVVDFFAGSGTTLHAVNLLNAEDEGSRRCILVTNNEVSESERKYFENNGIKPGDVRWEAKGIAHYVTWPRTVCSIIGKDIDGEPLKGNYIGSDIPLSEGFSTNAAFFKLGFLDKTKVSLRMQFVEMLPTLWMKAGAIGECPKHTGRTIPDMLILPQNKFAVLNDERRFAEFLEKIENNKEISTVYLVTDYESSFVSMTSDLNGKVTYQLYRDYLDNFRINAGRNSR